MTSIKENEWLAELARLSAKENDEGLTTQEWAERLGVSTVIVLRRLRAALNQGRLKRGSRQCMRLDGKLAKTPVYSIIPARKK